jgi:hypothetical protein
MFQIIPYHSVGPIRIGATSAELTNALGAPSDIEKNRRNELDYQYAGFGVRLSARDQTVVEVGFTPQVDVRFHEINIFNSSGAFEELIKKDGAPFEHVGFIILLNLGITLTGFHDNDASQKAVTVFAKGRWDGVRSKFKEYIHSSSDV